MRLLLMMSFLITTAILSAQTKPSHVYLFDVSIQTDTVYSFSKPRLLTIFNPDGYNHHPAFFNARELYVSVRMPDMTEPDIYSLSLDEFSLSRVTATAEGEYSPFLMPDNKHFSVVRTEAVAGETIQRLWQLPLDRLGTGKPVFEQINNVGYYQWLDKNRVVLFLVGAPQQLVMGYTDQERLTPITDHPGRCFRFIPGTPTLIYVQKNRYAQWMLMSCDLSTGELNPKPLTAVLGDSEDFAVMADGTILMCQGSKVFKYHPERDDQWKLISDLQLYGIKRISRISIFETGKTFQLAVVKES
jgi:hypothetical protein